MTKPTARTVRLGATGPEAFPLALGCMGMSGMYGPTDDAESLRVVARALDRGVTLLDTGDFYGMGHNEELLRRALAGRRERVAVSVKFGALRAPDGSWTGVDNRPVAVKNFAAYSLKRLGVEAIDVYRPARLDPAVPIEETVGAIADLVKAGYVRHVGLSEVSVETVRRATRVAPIVDVQLEYSIASRRPETTHFPALDELGVGATLYGVLSRGLFSRSAPRGPGDFRAYLPRFTGEHARVNAEAAAALDGFARARGVTPSQVAIAWVRARRPTALPVLGCRTVAQLDEALGALELTLSPADLAALEGVARFSGDRYAAAHMHNLDSER